MKKVLVIGGSGFIGRHIIEECIKKKWAINSLDISSYPTFYKASNCYTSNVDITELNSYGNSLDFSEFDFIYHLAALSDIDDCWNDPINAININIEGLCRVLERIRYTNKKIIDKGLHSTFIHEKPFKRFVYASSMYVYNTASGPYGITKRAAEDLIKWYQKEHGINYTILRYGSIYGPGTKNNNSMKKLIKNALKTGTISYYGTGEEVREYIHVKDLAKITVELSYAAEFENTTVNLTGQHPMKAKDMCYMLRDILGAEYKIEFRGEESYKHYMVTPYKYEQEIAKKYVSQEYYDMGAGLLELVRELDEKV